MHRPVLVPVIVLVAVAACGAGEPDVPAVVRRDSAGLAIVEASGPAWTPGTAWQVDADPAVEIGLVDGPPEYLLSQVEGAVRYADGRIVVANRQTQELRIYDADGTYRSALGRAGSGPGEYEYLRAVLRCGGDSIFGFDLSWQMNVYDPAGNFVRHTELEAPGAFSSPYALACGTNGVFVASGWGQPTRPEELGYFRTRAPITLFRPGEAAVTLADTLSSDRIASTGGSRPHPLGRSATMAVGADAVYLATGETWDVAVFGLDGRPRAIYRAPAEDLTITDAHVEAYRQEQLAALPESQHPALERMLTELNRPGSYPAYVRLTAATDGHLWAERFTPPGESGSRWAVFAPDGGFLGHVTMPGGLEVTEIGADYVLGIHQDQLGVERVRLHAIRRPGG